jgi:uncharacterized protein (DUF4415 family)
MSKTNTGKTVKFTLDAHTPLSAEQRTQLEQLKRRGIDLSDIPASPTDADWTRSIASESSQENKQSVTLRLDRDVLEFFRQAGKRYQTRINQVLRAYMHAHDGKR